METRNKKNKSLSLTITQSDDNLFRILESHKDYEDISFVINSNVSIKMIIETDKIERKYCFKLEKDASLTLNLVSFNDNFVSNTFEIDMEEGSSLDIAYGDFSSSSGKITAQINLKGKGSSANWNLASSSQKDNHKEFIINFEHLVEDTHSYMTCNGVVRDQASLQFLGDSHIYRGAKKSAAHQKTKIIVFDEACRAKANPILKIDENDIEASHAAALGKVSDEQLFYLCSRGIKEEDAKQLITLGYLRPVLKHILDEQIVEKIENIIEQGGEQHD